MRILRDLVAGHTDPAQLAQHRDPRCRASVAEITAALTGNYRPEHLFVLTRNLALYDVYQTQIGVYDAAIDAHLATLVDGVPPPTGLPPAKDREKPRDNAPRFEIRAPLHQLTGVDLSQFDGIAPTPRSGSSRRSGPT